MTTAIIEAAIARVSAIEDAKSRAAAREALSAVLALHADALRRLCTHLEDVRTDAGPILHSVVEDDVISSVFLLHDVHPWPADERVRRALDELRARIVREDQTGHVIELVSVDANRARVRVTGDESLRRAVIRAIEAVAPELHRVEIVDSVRAPDSSDLLVSSPRLGLVRRAVSPERPHEPPPDPDESPRTHLVPIASMHTHCELCGFPLAKDHEHLLDLKVRRLTCACAACAHLERRS